MEWDCKLKYIALYKDEEAFYKQKAKVMWINKGDKNTSFFFRKMRGHQARNKIISITRIDGQLIERENNVHKKAIRHFSEFLGYQSQYNCALGRLQVVIKHKLDEN